MYRTNPKSWLHQDSKMVPCAQCTRNPMVLWLRVRFIEYSEYSTDTWKILTCQQSIRQHVFPKKQNTQSHADARTSSGKTSRLLSRNSLRDEVLREEPAPISIKPSW